MSVCASRRVRVAYACSGCLTRHPLRTQVTTLGRKRVEDLPAADGYEHINLAQAEAQERLVQKARPAACLLALPWRALFTR